MHRDQVRFDTSFNGPFNPDYALELRNEAFSCDKI